jgi:hypothetical protein
MGPSGNYSPCTQPIVSRVNAAMNLEFLRVFTAKEIKEALFQMAPFKAPGPDGLNAYFSQKNWTTLGDEVCGVLLGILNFGVMPSSLNMTHAALIPKKKAPRVSLNFDRLVYAMFCIRLYRRC